MFLALYEIGGILDILRRSRQRVKYLFTITAMTIATPCFPQNTLATGPSPRPIPSPVYGVTLDAVDHLSYTVDALSSLAKTPTTRIVFDEFVPAKNYVYAVNKIRPVSYIMGEILDSEYVSQYTVDQYKARAAEYLNTLGPKVDLWEIGNEINGEWLGDTGTVVEKMTAAYDIVQQQGGKTALTLYYNQDCWDNPNNEMFTWAEANITEYMKQGLDYVLVSYYEDDCNGLRPDWKSVFQRLGNMFPNSKIGFGETGTDRRAAKAQYLTRYYTMAIQQPQYIGGYFWWYFKEDMVPKQKSLWNVLNNAIAVEATIFP